jgi:hypothetical protein
MGRFWEDGGYSAEVRMSLVCEGKHYEVAEIGPTTLVLRNNTELPSGYAQIIIEIDGDREVQNVFVSCHNAEISELQYA